MSVLRAGRSQCKIERIRMVTHGRVAAVRIFQVHVYDVILEHMRIVDLEEKYVVAFQPLSDKVTPTFKDGI